MAMDALSAYWIASHTTEHKELNVTLSAMGRRGFKSHILQLDSRQVQGLEEELQVSWPLGAKGSLRRWAQSPTRSGPCRGSSGPSGKLCHHR